METETSAIQEVSREIPARSRMKMQNNAETGSKIDARLTHRCSPGVRYKRPPGNIYFIRAGAAIKIGYSLIPTTRKAQLQTSNAKPLELLATISGTQQDEYQIHRRFCHLHIRGEWFKEDPEILEFIYRTARKTKKRPALVLVHP